MTAFANAYFGEPEKIHQVYIIPYRGGFVAKTDSPDTSTLGTNCFSDTTMDKAYKDLVRWAEAKKGWKVTQDFIYVAPNGEQHRMLPGQEFQQIELEDLQDFMARERPKENRGHHAFVQKNPHRGKGEMPFEAFTLELPDKIATGNTPLEAVKELQSLAYVANGQKYQMVKWSPDRAAVIENNDAFYRESRPVPSKVGKGRARRSVG